MQHECPEVQAQETPMVSTSDNFARQMTVFRRLGRDAPDHHGDHTAECQGGRQHEQTRQTDRRHQQGASTSDSANISPMLAPTSAIAGPDLVASQGPPTRR